MIINNNKCNLKKKKKKIKILKKYKIKPNKNFNILINKVKTKEHRKINQNNKLNK